MRVCLRTMCRSPSQDGERGGAAAERELLCTNMDLAAAAMAAFSLVFLSLSVLLSVLSSLTSFAAYTYGSAAICYYIYNSPLPLTLIWH